jgi:hypothetical protein
MLGIEPWLLLVQPVTQAPNRLSYTGTSHVNIFYSFFTTLYINMHDVDIVYLHVSASHILKIIVLHKVDTLGKST